MATALDHLEGRRFCVVFVSIQASDGTALLRDADYFALVRVDDKMELVTPDEAEMA